MINIQWCARINRALDTYEDSVAPTFKAHGSNAIHCLMSDFIVGGKGSGGGGAERENHDSQNVNE